MVNLEGWLAGSASKVWPFLLEHLWQSTLFALVLLPVLLLLRRGPARLRYSIWLVASIKFVLPAAALVWVAGGWMPSGGEIGTSGSGLGAILVLLEGLFLVPVAATTEWVTGQAWLSIALSATWIAGTMALALLWWSRRRRFVRALSEAELVTDGTAFDLLQETRARLGLRRTVTLALLSGAAEPGVWGTLRPTLVVPSRMLDHLSRSELEAIFLHELLHVRRWDNLVANLHMVLCCLFWFHPLVWVLDRRLLAAREEACDERVVELCERPEHYASGLLKAVRFSVGLRLAGVSSAHASDFRKRIERILSPQALAGPSALRQPFVQRACLAAGLVLLLGFSLGAGLEAQLAAQREAESVAPCPKKVISARSVPPAGKDVVESLSKRLPAAPPEPWCLWATVHESSTGSHESPRLTAR